MEKVLGLDIGISSVGWGVIEKDTGEIIDAGVRIFEEASRNVNEDRRNFRGSRRLNRRRTTDWRGQSNYLQAMNYLYRG